MKYRNPDDVGALDREKRRQQDFEDVDLGVVRWGARDLVDFSPAAGRIERARARARARARQRLGDGAPQWVALDATGAVVPVRDSCRARS